MANILNIASDDTLARIATAFEKQVAINEIVDKSGSPGGNKLVAGNKQAGLFGFVKASDFITGSALATAIGMTAGNLQNDTTPWIKYMWNGKICFTPLKAIRNTVTWDDIYKCGCVYGTDNEGLLPPAGRLGANLSINSADNSINGTNLYFQGDKTASTQYADTVGVPGDIITLKGWSNAGNNGDATIVSITNNKIVVSGLTLTTENGTNATKVFKKSNAVTQNKTVIIGGLTYSVSLPKGSNVDIHTKDSDAIGLNNGWNWIIGQLHEQTKLKNWAYPQFMDSNLGDFGVYLTDKDLCTHYSYGAGSLSWCKEIWLNDSRPWLRVYRGSGGSSYLNGDRSWNANGNFGFRPRLELSQTATL